MSCYAMVKLVVTITILVIAFSPPNQLLSALYENISKNQNHASAERMEATADQKSESQAHLKELREMDDDEIDLSTEGPHVRTRRQTSIEENPSSINQNSCDVDPDVHERLEDVKNLVKITREKRQEIEKKLVKILKERQELLKRAKERNATGEIEILMHVIKKTEDEGNALLQSEKKRANDQVSALQNKIDRLNANKTSDVEMTELRAKLVRTTSDVAQQKLINDDMKRRRDFAETRKQAAIQRNEVCVKLLKDLNEMQSNFDGNSALRSKKEDIGNLDGLLSDKKNCCSEKGCDLTLLELRL